MRLSPVLRICAAVAITVCATFAHADGWTHKAPPFEALLRALVYDDPAVRATAADSLGRRGQPAAVSPLLAQLEGESDPAVRRAIYRALGALGDLQGRQAIFRCLDEEAEPAIRAECAAALGRMPSARALDRLLALLDPAEPQAVRTSAVEAIGGYDSAKAIERLTGLLRAAEAGDPEATELRGRAISALGRTGSPNAVGALMETLGTSRDAADRAAILRALAPVATPAERPQLEALLRESREPEVRAEAAIALAATEATSFRASLERLLTDAAPGVQRAAVERLHRLGDAAAAPALASHADRLQRQVLARGVDGMAAEPAQAAEEAGRLDAALQAMVALDPMPGLTTLMRCAEPMPVPDGAAPVADAVTSVRDTALRGLGDTRSAEAAAVLRSPAGIGDPEPRLRAAAARSLAALNADDAAPTLIDLLQDPAPETRRAAAESLGSLATTTAIAPLEALLAQDGEPEVRVAAAHALGWLGEATDRSLLQRAAETDNSDAVRRAARLALHQLDR